MWNVWESLKILLLGPSSNKDLDEEYRGFALSSAEISVRFKKNGVTDSLPQKDDPKRFLVRPNLDTETAAVDFDETSDTDKNTSTLYESEATETDVNDDPTTDLDITATLGEVSLATSYVTGDETD